MGCRRIEISLNFISSSSRWAYRFAYVVRALLFSKTD
jgi:hypothetical protein